MIGVGVFLGSLGRDAGQMLGHLGDQGISDYVRFDFDIVGGIDGEAGVLFFDGIRWWRGGIRVRLAAHH